MIICPECAEPIASETNQCTQCNWFSTLYNQVYIMLNKHDQNNPLFNKYIDNYNKIAIKDIMTPFLDNRYIEIQAEKICKLLPTLTDKDVCDIGSGRGYLIRMIQKQNPKSITAVDISLPYLEKMEQPIKCYQANAENLPFKNQFDVICCTDVMEHVINVGGFLYSLNRALRLNGYAAIRVPYKENLLNYAAQNGCEYEFAHLRDFNRGNIKNLLSFAGFKVLSIHLDSFSLQIPQNFWLNNQRRLKYYVKLQSFIRKQLSNDSDINLYPAILLRFFMRPIEMTVICKKKKELQ